MAIVDMHLIFVLLHLSYVLFIVNRCPCSLVVVPVPHRARKRAKKSRHMTKEAHTMAMMGTTMMRTTRRLMKAMEVGGTAARESVNRA